MEATVSIGRFDAVEAQVVGVLGVPPEPLVEPVEQVHGLSPQPPGVALAVDEVEQVRHPELGVVDVALQLDERDRRRREAPVPVGHGVAGVLPALVDVAVRRPRRVLLEPVAVAVAPAVDPAQRGVHVREIPADGVEVAQPVEQVRHDDQEQRRRVVRAVVGRVREDPGRGELAVPDLVEDLARLHVADGVVLGRLHRREPPQGAVGELRVAADRVHRHDQRVAPEDRHVPRHAGGRHDHPALEGRVLETERLEVPDRLGPGPADGLVRCSRRPRRGGG